MSDFLPPMSEQEKEMFSEERVLLEQARSYIELREAQKLLAIKDPAQTPTPQLMSKKMNVSMERLDQIIDVAENHLGDFEMAEIKGAAVSWIDVTTSKERTPE